MKSLYLFLVLGLTRAQTSSTAVPNSLPMPAASTSMAMSAAATSSSPPYSITALPAVSSQPSCVYNCLIPIGLADPSGCDDVSNDCACLSAPNDVLDVLTGCVETVCKSSTSAYAKTATSLYESYCQSLYGTASFSQAFVAESSAAASSSIAAAASSSIAAAKTASGGSSTGTTPTPTPSPTAKSLSIKWRPSLFTATFAVSSSIWLILLL
ncbi:hypothetical protein BDR22DRAFT_884213 [Usnea florida]